MLDTFDDRSSPFRQLLDSLGRIQPGLRWTPHVVWMPVSLIDGRRASGTLMRRRANGRWQYRRLTDDERIELAIDRSW